MKVLHAKVALISNIGIFLMPGIVFILLAIACFLEEAADYGVPLIVLTIIGILIGTFMGMKIYCTHWIKYGDGKVVIR